MNNLYFALLVALSLVLPCTADTITVNWDGSSDYTTIQAGINAAVSGADSVIVAEGTYVENISFGGKDIILTSTDPNDPAVVEATIIDGGGTGRVVTFLGTETSNCVLTGFTVTNGYLDGEHGPGINGYDCTATINNCIIRNNTAISDDGDGGGIYNLNGLISGCIVRDNTAYYGGGIAASHGRIENCLVYGNYATNRGGAMNNCDGDIVNCTVVDNSAAFEYVGVRICNGPIINCIIWGHSGVNLSPGSTPTYSCIQGWSGGGTGNISDYPGFADPCGLDYHLLPGSLCIDTGTNSPPGGLPSTDIEGNLRTIDGDNNGTATVDMGAYESILNYVPIIELSSPELEFVGLESGPTPDGQVLTIRNGWGGMLNWQIIETCDWLMVNPTSGSSMGEPNDVMLSVDISGLDWGMHNYTLTVSDPNASNNPQLVDITLRIFMENGADFGDCPDPNYPTLLSSDGARHLIDPSIFLGELIDEEVDGQPGASADGDDLDYLADEDGVSFTSVLPIGATVSVEVVASDAGKLDAWIDFNIDGDWADPCEQIFANEPLSAGANNLQFDVPANAEVGDTYARFRFSTAGGLSYDGPADDGEVEDYMVNIMTDCMASTNPDYSTWATLAGKPDCWCYCEQCNGDSNGGTQFSGSVTVYTDDLDIFLPAFGNPDVATTPGHPGWCADLDHKAQFGGLVRVYTNDLDRLLPQFGSTQTPRCSGPGCFGSHLDIFPGTGCDTNPLPNSEFNFWVIAPFEGATWCWDLK
jgi:hypothetical protein